MRDFDEHAFSSRPRLRLAVGIIMLVLVAGGIWGAIGLLWPEDDGKIVLLKADNTPYKVKPDDKGGMQIPHQDKLIFNTVSSDGKMVTVERILPGPEQPMHAPVNNMDIPSPVAPIASSVAAQNAQQPAAVTQAEVQAKAQIAAQTAPAPTPAPTPVPQAKVEEKPAPKAPEPVAMGRVIDAPKVEAKPEPSKSPSKDKDAPVKPAAAFDMSKVDAPKPDALKVDVAPSKVPEPEPEIEKEIFKEAPKELVKEEPKEEPSFKGPKPKETASKAENVADDDAPDNEPVKKQADEAPTPSSSSGGRVHFQLASFFDKPSAEKGITQFRSKYAGDLQGASLSIAQAKINGNKSVFRIQGSAANADTASSICADIKAKGGSCVLIRP